MGSAVKVYKHFQTPKTAGVYHRLICLTGEKKGIAYFIMDKQRVVLGRSENADIRVLDLKSSREHAEIIQVGTDFILTDLGSQNGIIVNDLKVKQHVLTDGDKIIIGKTVYKFSQIEVKAVEEEDLDFLKNDEDEVDSEDVQRDKRLAKILLLILVLAFVMFEMGDSEPEPIDINQPKSGKFAVKEFDDEIIDEVRGQNKRNQESKEKLERYFHRGLREYREGNFFRAYAEFQNAKQWAPKDPTANFYLRKTAEKQNEIISTYFSKGSRDIDALNYKAAETAYCTIVRLLIYNTPKDDKGEYSDPRIKQARESLRLIEKKTGREENSIECTRKADTDL